MAKRTVVLFWGSAAAAVLFLGWAWASAGRMNSGGPAEVVFGVSALGFLVTVFVAGRIILVLARLQRRARRYPSQPRRPQAQARDRV